MGIETNSDSRNIYAATGPSERQKARALELDINFPEGTNRQEASDYLAVVIKQRAKGKLDEQALRRELAIMEKELSKGDEVTIYSREGIFQIGGITKDFHLNIRGLRGAFNPVVVDKLSDKRTE